MSMSLRVVSSFSAMLVIMSCGGGGSSTPTSPQTGTVSGSVTSGGTGVSGASVTVTPSGQSALASVTTSGTGTYSVSSVPVGSGTVTVSNLPSGCATPAASNYSGLTANGTATINVAVTCTQLGTVSGTVTNSSTSAGIAGATIVVTPTGGTALASVTTSSSGVYTVHNVPLGGGAVAVSNLPSGCTTPAATSYSGVTAGGTVTVNIAVTCTSSGGQAVLFAISKNNTVFGFTAAQLTGTGSVTPAVSFLTGNAASGYGITFDGSGNMWLGAGVTCSPCSGSVTYTGHVYEYTPSQIASANGSAITPNVDISVLSGSAVGVYDVKFDNQGTLWVTASSYNSLRGYGASQLTASGSPTPAHFLKPQSVAITNALAFDASGLLWVGSSSNVNETVGSGKLAVGVPVTGGTEDSIVTDGHGGGLLAFIAFDKNGNMWISGGQDSIVAFTKSQIPSGSDASPAEPNIVITLPTGIAQPLGMAFDADGNLWVICAQLSTSANSELLRIPAAQLSASGKAVPDVGLIISTDAANNFFGTPRGLAFAPGAGLPLNTSRVVHATRTVRRRR
jgi:hypothetical protein